METILLRVHSSLTENHKHTKSAFSRAENVQKPLITINSRKSEENLSFC